MPKNKRLEFPDIEALGYDIEQYMKDLPTFAAETAVNFFKDRFVQKGWMDTVFEKWKPNQAGTTTLLKSGNLRDSFDYNTGQDWVEVTNFALYSSIHNEGGILTVRITKKSRSLFWYMFKKTEDPKWKYMAMTKKEFFQIKIDKRQFMGHSNHLMRRLELHHNKALEKLTDKHLG